jgi:integrase
MCMYCNTTQSHLARHLKLKHPEMDSVKAALQLPPGPLQTAAFDRIKKEGIFELNKRIISSGEDIQLQREYTAGNGTDEMKMCTNCKGFYASSSIYKHKQECAKASVKCTTQIPSAPMFMLNRNPHSDPAFEKILRGIRNEKGILCRTDTTLGTIGLHQWQKSAKKDYSARKSVATDMRQLAQLILTVRSMENDPSFTCADLFVKTNFVKVTNAIDFLTIPEPQEEENEKEYREKNNLKISLCYLLKTAATIMIPTYLIDDQEEKAKHMETFLIILQHKKSTIVNPAVYQVRMESQARLRCPKRLPLEEDVAKLQKYINTEMVKLARDDVVWNEHTFNHLRALLICRLTVFNGRRGGEPARMTLLDWKRANDEVWINKQKKDTLDEIDKALLGKYKLAYMEGKGRCLVGILIPLNCIPAIKKLVSLRKQMGICAKNKFLFPAGRKSLEHPQGSQVIAKVCSDSGVTADITATDMRHRASEEFSLLDLTDAERKAWFKHMGHSEAISTDVYTCPAGIREVLTVGKYLERMDYAADDAGKELFYILF